MVFLISGCAELKTVPLPDDPTAHFPKMKTGDKYTFVISGMDQERWEVASVQSDGGFILRQQRDDGKTGRVMRVDSAYLVTSDEKTTLRNLRLDFPLFPGKRWSFSYTGEDGQNRPVNWIVDYHVVAYETVQTGAGPLRVFKIKYILSAGNLVTSGGSKYGEIWYSPEAKMIVYHDGVNRSHKILAFSVSEEAGKKLAGSAATAQPVKAQSSTPKPQAQQTTGTAEAVRLAETKAAAVLKAQEEKETSLKAQAQRLAEKEAALKAEANRLTEEKLASESRRLSEQEALLKAEAKRLEEEKRTAEARARSERENALKALAAAKASADIDDVEANIPLAARVNPDAIAVVIGNRDYRNARKVAFAINDAETMKKYLLSTLGYKAGNVFFLPNAAKADFELYFGNEKTHRGKLFNAIKEGKSDVFIYYSGHGAPGLKDRRGYFVPTEADPQYLELSGYSLDVLYDNLAKLPARSITVVLDACFSGSTVYENVSPLVLELQSPVIRAKNMVVVSSAAGSQVSSWYNEKNHSMFTYFLLRALKDKSADTNHDGKLTFDELYSYLSDKSEGVPYYARRINGVEQDPTISGQYQGRVLLTY
jgi:hypothetical protein